MHPETFISLILSCTREWSIRGSIVTRIAHNDREIWLTTADKNEHVCLLTGDFPHTIQDIPRPEAIPLGAPTRPEKIWVYDPLNSEPGQEPDIVLINEQALEENDRTIAKYRTRRDQRAQATREAREDARKERWATYQRDHVERMGEILKGKTGERIVFTDGGFSITVGGLLIRVTPDVRSVPTSEFGDGHAVGLRVSFGDRYFLSTHDLDNEG